MNAKKLLTLRKERRNRPVQTPTVIQMEALECGAAALAIVLAFHGRWVSIEELRVTCGVSRNGSKAKNILEAARNYGLDTQAFKVAPARLSDLKLPVILHWNFSHYVVFEGFDRRGRALINDPAFGRRKVSTAEFDESMTGVVLTFSPGPSFERKGEPPRLLRALRNRLRGASAAIAFVFFLSLLLLVPGLFAPSLTRLFIDHVMLGHEAAWTRPLLLAMVVNLTVLCVVTWLQRSFLLRFQTQMAVDGARRFFWHLLRLPMEFFNQRFTGDISSRIGLNDRVADLLSGELAVSALSFLVLLFFACVMVQYDAVLTQVTILVVALNLFLLRRISRRRADDNKRLLKEENRLQSVALWGLDTIETLKATSSEGDLFARWSGQQAKVINLRQQMERANRAVELLPPLFNALNAAVILGLGGLRVMQGRLSVGGLVAFQILTVAFTSPVNRLVSFGRRLQIAEGEVGLLDDVLQARPVVIEPPAVSGGRQAGAKLSGHLRLSGITFGYSPLDAPVVQEINLEVRPGACVAVIGKTGSGKSTITKLVSGLYEPWRGSMLFDGRLRSELPRGAWMNSVAVVDQDIFTFEGTVRENLQLWNKDVSEERLLAAAGDAAILQDILARPGQFEAAVSEGGVNWSGGQLQRFEIARALAGDPSLLILDEATSALDAATETQIVHNLRRRGCACLLVAHRLSTIRDADEIIVLEDGKIVQRGRHAELIDSDGPYSHLVLYE
jgi:NHLM bacteriocin system ABC transporter peptidase/ATP-binding protein